MSFFERNLQLLIGQNPLLGAQLYAFPGNERFEVFQDPSDPLNVNIFDHLHNGVMYNGVPQNEIIEKVDIFEKEFSRYPVLFVYGVANGLFLKLLLQNTNHKHIIVIEPELELLYIALNLIDFSTEMEQRQLFFFSGEQINFAKSIEIFSDAGVKVFCKTYHLEPNVGYYETFYHEAMIGCNVTMIRAIEHVVTGLGNDTTDALIGLEWHLANVHKMVQTPTLLELIQKIKSTKTAIIISTGPSLAKQMPLLQSIKDHATLLSVDASLPILERHGIKPDIVFSIERVAETAEFYRRTSSEFQKGIICAISSLSHPLLVESARHTTMQMNMRPFGYTRYFKLPEYGYIGIGMSAANMAYETAYHGKFETIILIGQDLAYGTDGKSHSDGHIFGSSKQRGGDFEVEAYGGIGTVRTSMVWNMFRNFFENDIYSAKQDGVTTINATEGGARIHGAIEMPFSEAIKQYVDTTHTKTIIELTPPDPATVAEKTAQIEERIDHMESFVASMQKQVSGLFEKVAETVEELDRIKARKNLQKVDYDQLATLMGEIDEIKAKFDDLEFVDIFIDATQALIVHHELEIARIQVRAIQNDDDRRLKMIDWIYAHQSWLFALAGIMEAELIAIRRRGGQSQYVHKAEMSENGEMISGNFYDYTYKTMAFELELVVDGEPVKSKKLEVLHKLKGVFSIYLPSRFFNDQVHWISLRERTTGIVVSGMPENRILHSSERVKAEFFESVERIPSYGFEAGCVDGSIGFLASSKNLKDEGFIGYIRELQSRFPMVRFKAFYFNPSEKEAVTECFGEGIDPLLLCDVNTLNEAVSVYIHGRTDREIQEVVGTYCKNIYVAYYDDTFRAMTVYHQGDKKFGKGRHILEHYRQFGFSDEEVEMCDSNFVKLFYYHISDRLGLEKKLLADEKNLFDLMCFDYVDLAIRYGEFRHLLFDYRQNMRRLAG